MNDNDIIKALECCASGCGCGDCPLYPPGSNGRCLNIALANAIDLINRQKAEIERLKTTLSHSIGIDDTKQNGCFPFD